MKPSFKIRRERRANAPVVCGPPGHPPADGVGAPHSAERTTRRQFVMAGGTAAAALALTSYGGRAIDGRGTKIAAAAVPAFRTRPQLQLPALRVATLDAGAVAPGLVLIAPYGRAGSQAGGVIADNDGAAVWENPLAQPLDTTNLRVQTYNGKPALTWWQGVVQYGHGVGGYVIADTSYKPLAHVNAGNGYRGDLHEFLLTERNTALLTTYVITTADLRPVGGAANGDIQDAMFQEIDLASGRVLLEWHSLGHIAFEESYYPAGGRWDYVHLNSIAVDLDGNLLISSRSCHTIYKVDRSSGEIIWRLGGKRSDFELAPDAVFAWQHDARRQADGSISLFDNGNSRSRAIVLDVDETRRRVTLRRAYTRSNTLFANSQGNVQVLPNGNIFVGWGAQPYVTEFTPAGEIVFDARLGAGYISYRAYRMDWDGEGPGAPEVVTQAGANSTAVYVSWNGDTRVASWVALGGRSATSLAPVASAARTGFETRLTVSGDVTRLRVHGHDGAGRLLGSSKLITI